MSARAAATSSVVALVAVVAIAGVGSVARPQPAATTPRAVSAPATGAPGRFSRRTYTEHGTVYPYQVFLPHDYDPARTWPVVVALHGSGEKGSDGIRQIRVGVGPIVQEQADSFPAVVIFPQVPSTGQGVRYVPAMARLIDVVVHEVNGDPNRVYLTGISFGGVLAWLIARERPARTAAFTPISATFPTCAAGAPKPPRATPSPAKAISSAATAPASTPPGRSASWPTPRGGPPTSPSPTAT